MLTAEQNTQLLAVEHDQRWSFAFFLPGCKSACESYFGDAVEKLVDDDVVHLLCYQSRKTAMLGKAQSESPAVVAHTTQDWAKRHEKRGGRDERLLREVAAHVQKLLRVEGALTQLTDTSKVITWKQCQVTEPVASETPCMVVSREPPLLLAGDYFAESSFSGCLQSGVAAAEALSKLLGPPKAVHVEGKGSGGCGGKDKGKGKKGKDYSDDSDGPGRKGEFIGKKGEYGIGKGKGKKGKDYSDDSDGPGRKGEFIGKKGEYGKGKGKGKKGKDYSDDSDGPGRKGEFIGKKGEYGITWGHP
ncbi:unnamed protein product [Effrenium voratum]|nr:unnamed protein product [Effrenium voratum]